MPRKDMLILPESVSPETRSTGDFMNNLGAALANRDHRGRRLRSTRSLGSNALTVIDPDNFRPVANLKPCTSTRTGGSAVKIIANISNVQYLSEWIAADTSIPTASLTMGELCDAILAHLDERVCWQFPAGGAQ
ncbi:MAG: hypothetical protein QNJ97_17740 [Myxococcota bacterium]|nr:hypothetical protein [Myxococcota bacterium]